MGKVHKIGISKNKGGKIEEVSEIKVIAGKGIIDDRYFKHENSKLSQITVIELENINYYNKKIGTAIHPINFRRNIITKGTELNNLLHKEFFIGKVKLIAHDLCRPCKYLQETLNQHQLIKEMLKKSGLRCEILSSGNICIGDIIKY